MKKFFAPSAWRLGGAARRAAMMLLLCVMTCASAWAETETVTYTFYCDNNSNGSKSYIVYNGTNYKLSDEITWETGTATCGDVVVTINSANGDKMSIMPGGLSSGAPYSFSFSSSSKYISHVKIYTTKNNYEADNDTRSHTTPGLWKKDGYSNFYQVDLTLSDTQPVFTYNITYELNGGTNAPGNPTTYSNTTGATLADATKTGYTFGGWYDNAQFNGTAITEIPAGLTGNKTVYAKWTANTYSVAFNNNGGSGTMSNQSFTYDEAPKPLTSNTFTRTGYTYSGWNTAANGSGTAYTDGQSVQNLTDANGATVTLFAQWSPITYTVSFNNNGGEGTMTAQTHTYDSSLTLTPNAFTRTGYSFAGWATTAGGNVVYTNGQSVSNLATAQGANVELFAKWTPITYTVSFNANGGDGTMAAQTHTYNASQTLTANTFTRTGYTFAGWATTASGDVTYANSQSVSNLATAQGANVELFAKWNPITYTVSFNANGGTGTMAAQTHTYDASQALTANTFTLTGYSFDGWATTAGGNVVYTDEQTVSNLASTQGANVELFAKWSPVLSYFWGEGNDGSYEHPYIITTTAGLDLLATLVNGGNDFRGKYFRLGANIEYDSDVVNNFTPIGGYINGTDKYFNGNFNGQGSDGTQYEISGININKPDDRYIGLFGASYNNATLDNIVLRDATITGRQYVGGIVGNNKGFLYKCRVLNTSVTAIQVVSGVICGISYNDYRLINNYYYNCSAKSGNGATKTANIGTGNYHDIDGAKSIHKLSLGNYVNTTTSPTLTYKGTDYYAVGTPITLSYSQTVPEGKILFFTVNGEVIDGETFNMPSNRADATAAAVLEIDFAYYWGEGNDGSEAHPYVISTPSGLNVLATMTKNGEHYSGKFFRLGADIDMSDVSFNGIGAGTGNSFSGIFDGGIYDGEGTLTGRHTISGISISRDETAGVFLALGHYVSDSQSYIGGTVRNLVLEGTVSGGSSSSVGRIGGLAGNVFQNSTVENCVSLLLVDPGYPIDYKGSLVGTNEGTVTGCYYLGMGGPGANVALNAVGNGNDAINCTPLYSVEVVSGGDYPVTMSSMTSDGTIYGDRYHVAGTHVTMTLSAPDREGYALAGFKYQVYNENTYSYDDVNLTDNNDGTYTLTVPAMNVTIEANYSYNGLAGLAQDDQNRYLVTSMNDLRAVATAVDVLDGCSGMTFLLANDIENAGAFSGIAVGTTYTFYGTFDGGGHTISGMTIESDASQVGFIGNLNGTLQNLTLKNCTVTSTDEYAEAGMLAGGFNNGYMYHCRVLGGTVTAPYASAIANSFYPDGAGDNRYTQTVTVVSDGVTRNPGQCGCSEGDRTSYDAAALVIALANNASNSALIETLADDNEHDVMLLDRKLWKDGDWNTLCLPFGISDFVGTIFADADIRALSSASLDDGVLTLNFTPATGEGAVTSITAGQPYIVKWDNTEATEGTEYTENPVFSGVTISSTTAGSFTSVDGKVQFLGTYDPAPIANGNKACLFLGSANTLYWPDAKNYKVGAFRAYFKVDLGNGLGVYPVSDPSAPGVRSFVLNFDAGSADDSSASGIAVVPPANDADGDVRAPGWYTLDGVRLDGQPTKKGLYIHGGKKVVIK